MIKDNLNILVDIAIGDNCSNNIIDARKEYQSITGNIYEDDKSYENRMALFLEWYIFDRISSDTDQSLLDTLIQKNKENRSSNMLQTFEMFANNIHGLFIVKKISDYYVKVLNLFDNKVYEVNESLGKLIFSKSGIFEGRLILYDHIYHFTGSFCFHPIKAKKYIIGETKQISNIIQMNKKELKNMSAQLDSQKKDLHKISCKMDKLKTNLLKSPSENKTSAIKKKLPGLETQRSDLEKNVLVLENELKKFTSEKTIRAPKALQTKLIQKLSHMQLVWERSRLIDLDDIYHS